MPAAFDDESMAIVDLRPCVVTLGSKLSKRTGHIETSKCLGTILNVGALRDHAGRKPLEDLQLQSERALGSAGNFCFEFAEVGGGKANLAGEGLAVDEGCVEWCRHQPLAVLGGDFDEIAEHVIVLDLEDTDARVLGVARLQARDNP